MNKRSALPYLGTFNRTDQEDPLKVFRFQIEIEGFARFGFSKCTGLKANTDVVEYREGGSNTTPQKSPGMTKFPDITLERGQIYASAVGETDIIDWYGQVFNTSAKEAKSSAIFRKTLEIVQFNKEGEEILRWRVLEAWPKDHSGFSDLDATSSNNSIESVTVVHEGFQIIRK